LAEHRGCRHRTLHHVFNIYHRLILGKDKKGLIVAPMTEN
jgi:hypothetical protein